MVPAKKQLVQSVVASIAAVVPRNTATWAYYNMGYQYIKAKNRHYHYACKETKVF